MRNPSRNTRLILILILSLAASAAACGGTDAGRPAAPGELRVVATTSVLADLVRNVAGEAASVTSVVPPGVEVHTFDPSPSDARSLATADVLFANGLGLDEWAADLARQVGREDLRIVLLGEGLDGVEYLDAGGQQEEGRDGHEGEDVNPHLWLDVEYAAMYVERIGDEMAALDIAGAPGYRERRTGYAERLRALDREVRERMADIPEADRRVVSFHEALPYFAAAYGLEVVGVVVEAPGQEPSAGEVAALIEEIRRSGVRAILAEAQFSPEIARAIAAETEAVVVDDLHTDSLGDPPLDTYEGLVRWDVDRILEALL